MSVKFDASTSVKNVATAPVELAVPTPTPETLRKKHATARKAKAADAQGDARLEGASDTAAQELLPQESTTPVALANDGVALAAMDPTWFVEPGTAPVATDAAKSSWMLASSTPVAAAAETNVGTIFSSPSAVEAPAAVVHSPTLSAMGSNVLAIGLGVVGLGLAANGLGGSTGTKEATTTIKVVDGPIRGANVFLDVNDNGAYDAGTDTLVSNATTDASGVLTVPSATLGKHGLIVVGGTNDSGVPNNAVLSLAVTDGAPLAVVSPVTTLVTAVYLQLKVEGKSFKDAEKVVKDAFGITDSASLSSIDPTTSITLAKAGIVLTGLAALPQDAFPADSLANYLVDLVNNEQAVESVLDRVTTTEFLQTVFASSLDALSPEDRGVANATLGKVAASNAVYVNADNATDLLDAQKEAQLAKPEILGLINDTGVANDNITTMADLKISAAGSNIEVSTDGGEHWVSADSFAPSDGELNVIARVNYGNDSDGKLVVSKSSDPFTFTLHFTTPPAPSIHLDHDTGVSSTDGLTRDGHFTVTAEQINGSVLQYRLGDSGDWVLDKPSTTEDGTYSVFVRQYVEDVDMASTETELRFTVDNAIQAGTVRVQASSDSGISNSDGITSNASPTLEGFDTDPGNTVSFTLGGKSHSVVADEHGHWEFVSAEQNPALILDEGSYTVPITISTAAGKEATIDLELTVDYTAPDDTTFTFATAMVGDKALTLDAERVAYLNPALVNDDNLLTLSGTADANARVELYIDDNLVNMDTEIIAADDGSWTFSWDGDLGGQSLPEGSYTVQAVVTDLAGNTSEPLDVISLTVDTIAPDAETVQAAALTGTGEVPTDDDGVMYFNAQSLPVTFSGTADVGATVEVFVDDTSVGTTTASLDDGSWSFEWDGMVDDQAFDDGTYSSYLVVTDLAGNVSEPLPAVMDDLEFVIDNTAPSADAITAALAEGMQTGTDPETGEVVYTNLTDVTINFTADPMETHVLVATVDGQDYDVTADEDGNWILELTGLEDKSYTVSVVGKDFAGNSSDPVEGPSFTVDATAPDHVDNVTAMVGDIELAPDAAGIVYFNPDSVTTDTPLTLSGTTDAFATIELYVGDVMLNMDTEIIAADDGSWTFSWDGVLGGQSLPEGIYAVQAVVMDLAGNTSELLNVVSFTVDMTAPDAETVQAAALTGTGEVPTDNDGVMYFNSHSLPVTFSGTADAGATVDVFVGETLVGTTTVTDEGDWRFEWDGTVDDQAFDDGTYSSYLVVTDLGGNISEPLPAVMDDLEFVIDNTAPSADAITAALAEGMQTGTDPETGEVVYTNLTDVIINFTADPTETHVLVVTVDGQDYDVTADEDGNWILELTGLEDKSYTVSVVATDFAGNSSDSVEVTSFTVDTLAQYYSGSDPSVDATERSLVHTPIAMSADAVDDYDINLFDGTELAELVGTVDPTLTADLPDGLTLDEYGHITGIPTTAGVTWLDIHAFDPAGNESIINVQLAVTVYTGDAPTTIINTNLSGTVVTRTDSYQYIADDTANTITFKYIQEDVFDVLSTMAGNDTISIGYSSGSTNIDSSQALFAMVDGGDGFDTLIFPCKRENIDLANFNSPAGTGGSIQHIEQLKFAGSTGATSSVTLSAADVFNLHSDATVAGTDGLDPLLVLSAVSSASNQFLTATLTDFTQVGATNKFTSTGAVASGTSNANYSEFHGVYTDYLGPHEVTVLVQGYFVLG